MASRCTLVKRHPVRTAGLAGGIGVGIGFGSHRLMDRIGGWSDREAVPAAIALGLVSAVLVHGMITWECK